MTEPASGRRISLDTAAHLLPYDRTSVTPGMVHLRIDAFHRAHVAEYIDNILKKDLSWGIVGASLRRPDTRKELAPQDFLYTLAVSQPAKAPAVMMPSMPRLRTPARSQMNSPRAPKMSGEAMRMAAARSDARTDAQSGAAQRWTFDAVTVNPARAMHLEGYGLATGRKANFVVLQARDPIEAIRLKANRPIVVRGGEIIAETPEIVSTLAIDGRPPVVNGAKFSQVDKKS